MKILLVIDHFGSGGAQRQIVELACGLKERGHDVEMFVYFPQHDFFRSRVEKQQIVIHEYSKVSRFSLGVIFRLATLIRKGGFDIVVSYLKSTNSYAELAKLIAGGTTLIVSERTSYHDDKSWITATGRRIMHIIADQVVANSVTQSDWLKRKWWLKNKVTCIYNGLDLNVFHPGEFASARPPNQQDLRLVGVGRIGPEKNIENLIEALNLLHDELGYVPHVSWAGRRDESLAGQIYCQRVDELLDRLPAVQRQWHWLGTQSDIAELLQQHHALIHPSSYEGLPNVVCEGLAAGLPVLISDVCDHSLLVSEGQRGFLFNPNEPTSIAAAIRHLANVDLASWRSFSRNAREYAVANLGSARMVSAYESLFVSLIGGPADGGADSK